MSKILLYIYLRLLQTFTEVPSFSGNFPEGLYARTQMATNNTPGQFPGVFLPAPTPRSEHTEGTFLASKWACVWLYTKTLLSSCPASCGFTQTPQNDPETFLLVWTRLTRKKSPAGFVKCERNSFLKTALHRFVRSLINFSWKCLHRNKTVVVV